MPKEIILIAAVTIDGKIARHNKEVTTWSKDLHVFKAQTMGYPVVMGSNTYDTLATELENRDCIVVHRDDNVEDILNQIQSDRCFIIGGGITNARFAKFLTHLYITPHPFVFGQGVSLFEGDNPPLSLTFQNLVPIDEKGGIFQHQYRVLKS